MCRAKACTVDLAIRWDEYSVLNLVAGWFVDKGCGHLVFIDLQLGVATPPTRKVRQRRRGKYFETLNSAIYIHIDAAWPAAL